MDWTVKCQCHSLSMRNKVLNNFLLSKGFVISVSGFDQMRCKQRRHHQENMLAFRIHIFYSSCLKLFFFLFLKTNLLWLDWFYYPVHIWRYSPFQALAFLIRRLHSSLFSALLPHLLIPSSCNASLWTTSSICFLVFPLVLWCRSFRFSCNAVMASLYSFNRESRDNSAPVLNNVRTFHVPKINSFSLTPGRRLFVQPVRGISDIS